MKLFCRKCSKVFSVDAGDSAQVSCPECGASFPRPESDLSPGSVIGDFIIEKSISKGGMGEVFMATQISLDRPVALKILQQEYTNDRDYVDSLFREARAAARINHPNIVPFLLQLGLFVSPVGYSGTAIHSAFWRIIAGLNPIFGVIGTARWALFGIPIETVSVVSSVLVSLLVFVIGFAVFRQQEKGFSDYI